MKGDISRQTFEPRKHYTQVVMQQGRVQLDADWNEQQAIYQHRIETGTLDIIGQNGTPRNGGGFAVSLLPGERDLLITPGRTYIDGILCELEEGTRVRVREVHGNDGVVLLNQVVDGRPWDIGQWVELLDEEKQVIRYCQINTITIDARELTLTFHIYDENPHLNKAEKERIHSIRRIITYTSQPDYPEPPYTRVYQGTKDYVESGEKESTPWHELDLGGQNLLLLYLDVWQRHIAALDDPSIREVALDGPDTTTRLQTVWQLKILPITIPDHVQRMIAEDAEKAKGVDYAALRASAEGTTPESQSNRVLREIDQRENEIIRAFRILEDDNNHETVQWERHIQFPSGRLNVTTYNEREVDSSGYQGQDNQLYRIEIHHGTSKDGEPDFKWARNNASILADAEVDANNPTFVTILSTGQGGILQFNRDQWVEVVSAEAELNPLPENLGDLVQITAVHQAQNKLVLQQPLAAGARLKLRLWDGIRSIPRDGEKWIPLHKGIQLQFSSGTYRRGDYWLIPARTVTKEVEWPPFQNPNTVPRPQRPLGIQHHYSRLARVRWHKLRRYERRVRDGRKFFAPLAVPNEAIHITDINWYNDTLNLRRILSNGLEITLSTEPDQRHARTMVSNALIISIEMHIPGGAEGIFILEGEAEIRGRRIFWRWNWEEHEGVVAKVFKDMDRLGHKLFASPRYFIRVRVRLLGHMIWHSVAERRFYLDGQVFALPGEENLEGRARLHLQLPSGGGAQASDFESWFYIKE
jgi:Family of unknown function (DUF6519)